MYVFGLIVIKPTKYGLYLIFYFFGSYFKHEIQPGKSLRAEQIRTVVQLYDLVVTENRNLSKMIETFDLDAYGL